MDKSYKYKLLQLIESGKISIKDIQTKCHVSNRTVYYWVNLKEDDQPSIPSDKLKIIAEMAQMSMDDLYTCNQYQSI